MITVFYGDDAYRSREAFRAARTEATRAAGTAALVLRDEELTPAALQTAGEGQTLFGLPPPLAVERLTRFTSDAAAAVADVLARTPRERFLLVWEDGVPAANGIVWRALREHAGALERCDLLGSDALHAWIDAQVRAAGREIAPDAREHLVKRFGPDTASLHAVLEVALLLAGGRTVTRADVETHVPGHPLVDTFSVVHAVLAGDPREALRLLVAFRQSGEDARKVLFWLARDLRLLRDVRERLDRDERVTAWDVARLHRLPRTAAELLVRTASATTSRAIRALLDRCAKAYYHLNTGRAEADELLELLVLAPFAAPAASRHVTLRGRME